MAVYGIAKCIQPTQLIIHSIGTFLGIAEFYWSDQKKNSPFLHLSGRIWTDPEIANVFNDWISFSSVSENHQLSAVISRGCRRRLTSFLLVHPPRTAAVIWSKHFPRNFSFGKTSALITPRDHYVDFPFRVSSLSSYPLPVLLPPQQVEAPMSNAKKGQLKQFFPSVPFLLLIWKSFNFNDLFFSFSSFFSPGNRFNRVWFNSVEVFVKKGAITNKFRLETVLFHWLFAMPSIHGAPHFHVLSFGWDKLSL